MNRVKINNGFYNDKERIILTGVLFSGNVNMNDNLILNATSRIPISDVEFDNKTFPGTTHVRLVVLEKHDVQWFKLYGKELEIESTKKS